MEPGAATEKLVPALDSRIGTINAAVFWIVNDSNGVCEADMRESLLKSFQGSEGRQRLIDALIAQPLIRDKELATVVEPYLKLEEIFAGTDLIKQGASDTDLFLILSGAFSIAIDGRIVARKKAGEHVGEMAVVDPSAPRSASVVATSDSVVARIAEPDFSALADRYPRLWRRLALELASQLRNCNAADRDREKAGQTA
jgi:CRP/FNR family cyclic AMP-dependent transcriptional regulator